jgi:hypothetical protein
MDEVLFSKTGPGPSGRTPSEAWAPMGELLFPGDTQPLIMAGRADLQRHIIHSRQGGPAASQAIGYPVSRWGTITALLIRHRGLRNHSVFIHRCPRVLHHGAPCGHRRFRNHSGIINHRRWCRNHSEHRRCRNHSAVNSGWRHHRIICVIIIAVGGQRWQDSGIIIEVGSAELQPHFTWLAGLTCSLTSHGRRKQNSSLAQGE